MNSERSPKHSSKNPLPPLLAPKFLGSRISNLDALAGLLEISSEQLTNLANTADSFYRLHERIEKPDGSIRLIYSVQEPLKGLLKKINNRILKRCEYPSYLTGSLPGTSYSSNASLHAGKGTVITIDATNFFPSISQQLVDSLWCDFFKFDDIVSKTLTKLCCFEGFLAQGSPPSSYLANLVFWDVEPLIVKELRAKGFTYSRYVDDICVSHKQKLNSDEKTRAILAAKKVFLSKGLKVKPRKTMVMDRNRRQTVNNRTVNAGRVCASKNLKYQLRAKVHHFGQNISTGFGDTSVEKRFESLKGQIRHFRQFNQSAADKLLEQLETIYSAHKV